MTSPRCSVELCLALDGDVVLLSGWIFEPAPGATVVFSGAESFRDDLSSKLARVPRPDVVAAFAEAYPQEILELNRCAGFLSLSTNTAPNEAGAFLLSLSTGTDEPPLVLEVSPSTFTGELDESTRGYLRHSMPSLLDALRGKDVQGGESLRALLASLGDGFEDPAPRPEASAPPVHPDLRGDAASGGDRGTDAPSRQGSSLGAPGARAAEATHFAFESAADGVAAAVDHVYFVPSGGVFVVGWLLDADGRMRSMRTEHAGGVAENAFDQMIRVSRPDVEREYGSWHRERSSDRFGFAFFAELPGATHEELESSLQFTLMTDSGPYRSVRPSRVLEPPSNPMPVIREMLTMVPPGDVRALFKHLGPAVESLWKHRTVLRERPVPVDVGEPVAQPAISVIVPIYGRHDLIEYQLSQFADDPDFRSTELIYVVDDPRIANDVELLCRDVQPLFRVPCRIISCARNHGFAGATNIGAAAARGRLLVLLNSDVMPKGKGWLGRLRAIYDALPSRGALAPKLLFPDGSLQNVGIGFEQLSSHPGLWIQTHPGKGYPSRPEGTGSAVPVAAVTTACLMVDRDLYEEVGGLDEGYIIGDVEDSDFCLKLRARGAGSYYAPSVELYHLELRAQNLAGSTEWRASLNLYNAWRMTLRWNDEIQSLSRSHG